MLIVYIYYILSYHCSLLTRYYSKKNRNCTSRHSNYCCGRSFVVTAYKPSLRILYCILRRLQLFQTSVNFQLLSVSHLRNTINTIYSHKIMWVGQPLKNLPWATATSATSGKVHSSKFTLWNTEQGIPRYKVQQSIKFIVLKNLVDLYS